MPHAEPLFDPATGKLKSRDALRSIRFGRVLQSHYNLSTGTMVSSMAGFKSDLARKSDEASERLGYEVRYAPADPSMAPPPLDPTE